jgi:hypothetical protein
MTPAPKNDPAWVGHTSIGHPKQTRLRASNPYSRGCLAGGAPANDQY